jgi:Ca2+-transporting ATPase
VLEMNKTYASESFRVLAFAIRKVSGGNGITERGLVFLGLQAMMDPPRPEVKESIQQCKAAGIKVVMVTGDHKETAVAVAKELDLIDGGSVITGEELEAMTDKQFDQHVGDITVYARVSPFHKVRITEALKRNGHIVAMTGDGVNDAPALKMADIGVAMGRTGTDVTREVADMVISDDNFATIVYAVEEGRGIYDNIRKTIAFLLSGNIAEIGVLLFAVLIGLPLPLAATQLLWINLVTEGLPALALSVDPISKGLMARPPRQKNEKLTDRMRVYFFDNPLILVASCLLLFMLSLNANHNILKAQTIALTTIVLFKIFQSFSCRSLEQPAIRELFDNRYLIIAALIAVAAHLLIMYVEPMQSMFRVMPLSVAEWSGIIFVSLVGFFYIEISKAINSKKMMLGTVH